MQSMIRKILAAHPCYRFPSEKENLAARLIDKWFVQRICLTQIDPCMRPFINDCHDMQVKKMLSMDPRFPKPANSQYYATEKPLVYQLRTNDAVAIAENTEALRLYGRYLQDLYRCDPAASDTTVMYHHSLDFINRSDEIKLITTQTWLWLFFNDGW